MREREATPADVPAIARIWNEGIADRIATLDEDPKTEADVDAWFADHDARYTVTVALDGDGHVVGWASLNRYSDRRAYAGVADLSIYIARESRGQGIGKQLLRALEVRAKQNEFHKIVLFALARNDAGMALYRTSGYRDVGTFREQGRLDGVPTDVIAMEKLL